MERILTHTGKWVFEGFLRNVGKVLGPCLRLMLLLGLQIARTRSAECAVLHHVNASLIGASAEGLHLAYSVRSSKERQYWMDSEGRPG